MVEFSHIDGFYPSFEYQFVFVDNIWHLSILGIYYRFEAVVILEMI